jgi:short-subunit dehydrogenase
MTTQSTLGTALITGASSGIGEVYADRLAKRGYDLILVARNVDRLAALANRLTTATGRTIEVITADLGVAADRKRVEARLRTDTAITLLVNNAGLAYDTPIAQADPDRVEAMLDVNVTALTRLAAAAAANFTAAGCGAIINLSSVLALLDTPNTAAYGATKAYVLSFTHALHLDLAPLGIQLQAVLPGYTRTPMISFGEGIPDAMIMEVDDLVDAALAGFDRKELVTIPAQHDAASYDQLFQSRQDLLSKLVFDRSAPRYAAAV